MHFIEDLIRSYHDEGEGGGTPPADPPPDPPAEPKVFDESYVKQLRTEAANNRKKAADAEARLTALEAANQTEAERLAARAARADELESLQEAATAELETLRAALVAEVEAQAKTLPKTLRGLMPEGSPATQLEWIRKARDAADELKPKGAELPPAGGRSPAHTTPNNEISADEKAAVGAHYAGRF